MPLIHRCPPAPLPSGRARPIAWGAVALGCAALLAACSSGPRAPAPVEDRGPMARSRTAGPSVSQSVAASLPGAENAGKPGYYSVRPGDTLVRIALDAGQNWRDIARWNNLGNPNLIEVGQVLRVVPPPGEVMARTPVAPAGSVAPQPLPAASGVQSQPIASAQAAGTPLPPQAAGSAPSAAPASVPAPAGAPVAPASPDDDVAWAWPTPSTTIVGTFDEARNKGLDIAGKAGDPVFAAADGRVVYAGAGLRGYGNLIILKHNNTYLTAYAHNQALLVKEDQTVRRGQKIAEMGSTDADRVKLHFEIRRQGRPVDPAKLLPAR